VVFLEGAVWKKRSRRRTKDLKVPACKGGVPSHYIGNRKERGVSLSREGGEKLAKTFKWGKFGGSSASPFSGEKARGVRSTYFFVREVNSS